jgi:hypothetical protein
MAFSATDWRSRLSFYTNGNNYDHSFGYLGNQQGNLKYYTAGYIINAYTGYGRIDYWSCAGAGNTPVVEAFNANADYRVDYDFSSYSYNGYFNATFYDSGNGISNYGTWYFSTGQSGFSSNSQQASMPAPGGSSFYFFSAYYGHIYFGNSGYNYYLAVAGNGYNHSPSTFYNYKNGPFLSYYQYSLSSGTSPFTNFPYQTLTNNASC